MCRSSTPCECRRRARLRMHVLTLAPPSIYTCLGHPFSYGKAAFDEKTVETDRAWMLQFTTGDQGLFYHLLDSKLVQGNKIKTLPGGLAGIIDGLKLLEEGKVRGVCELCEPRLLTGSLQVSGEKLAVEL